MKQDFSHCEETITNMISVLQGSSHSPKQINILVSLLRKLTIEQYSHQKMDEILDLFVVLYLKCSRDVQLTFLDDIDKMYLMIVESQQQIFVERKFQQKLCFFGMYQFKKCLADSPAGICEDEKCDILRLEKIKARLKRYDIHAEGSNQKVSLSAQPCL